MRLLILLLLLNFSYTAEVTLPSKVERVKVKYERELTSLEETYTQNRMKLLQKYNDELLKEFYSLKPRRSTDEEWSKKITLYSGLDEEKLSLLSNEEKGALFIMKQLETNDIEMTQLQGFCLRVLPKNAKTITVNAAQVVGTIIEVKQTSFISIQYQEGTWTHAKGLVEAHSPDEEGVPAIQQVILCSRTEKGVEEVCAIPSTSKAAFVQKVFPGEYFLRMRDTGVNDNSGTVTYKYSLSKK